MVQRIVPDRCVCRPIEVSSETIINSPNDDSIRIRRLSVTKDAPDTVSKHLLSVPRPLRDYCSIQACELIYRLDSGEMFQITRTHPEPQKINNADHLSCPCRRSAADVVRDSNDTDTESESGLSQGLLRIRRNRAAKRKRGKFSSYASVPRKTRRRARGRQAVCKSEYNSEDEDSTDERAGGETELQQIRIDQAEEYYERGFRSVGQLVCKDIGTAWIRACHPRKQTRHPYNGGKFEDWKERSQEEYGYEGHYTKPDYWPNDVPVDRHWNGQKGVRHVEPHHLLKPERLKLLVHLLRCESKGFKHGHFSLDKLIKSTDGIHLDSENKEFWTPECLERLEEIYRVRAKELQYEQDLIDGDTVITVQMPKRRANTRKAPNSAAEATKPSGKKVRKGPRQNDPTVYKAPVANMRTGLQKEDGEVNASIHTGTSSPIEEVAPGTSGSEPTLRNARTMHEWPWREDRRQESAQEDWTLPQDRTIFTDPSSLDNVLTPGNAQGPLPPRDQDRFGSSFTQTYHDAFARRQNDHAPGLQVPNGTIIRSPSACPIPLETGNLLYPGFGLSSSGLAGFYPADSNYLDWQTGENLDIADTTASPLPPTNGSFSSGHNNANFSTGPQLDPWNDGSQTLMLGYYQNLVEEQHQQCFGGRAHHLPQNPHLNINIPSTSSQNLTNQSFQPTAFGTRNLSSGTEHNFGLFPRDQ